MNTNHPLPLPGRGRRTNSLKFKTQLVAACRIPDMSLATVAREHGIDHKVLHRWLREVSKPAAFGLSHATDKTVSFACTVKCSAIFRQGEDHLVFAFEFVGAGLPANLRLR